MSAHLDWETVNDWVDDTLGADAREDVRRHLARCSACLRQVEALEGAMRRASEAPRELAPPDDVWPALRATLDARKVVPLPSSAAGARPLHAQRGERRSWRLAAAAIMLVAASSTVTMLVMRNGGEALPVVTGDSGAIVATPVAFLEAEREYVETARELSEALDVARAHLAPQTIAIVERNLAVIDSAIAESRAVLQRDPGNRVLVEVLTGIHRQKLDLLRRAAQLAAS